MRKIKLKELNLLPTANMNKLNYPIELYKIGNPVKVIDDITGVSKAILYKKLESRCDSLVPYFLYNIVGKRRI